MVTLPKDFVSTKYPGYFWHIEEKRLYSVKVTGTLKPLHFNKPNYWNNGMAGYQVSVDGHKKYLYQNYLLGLKPKKEIFPVWDQPESP